MPARFGGDGNAAWEVVLLGADDLEIERAGVAALVKNPDIPEQVDVAAAVGLQLGWSGILLAAFAVADVDVADALDHGADGLDRVLAGAPDVTGVHVKTDVGVVERVEDFKRGRRIVDV